LVGLDVGSASVKAIELKARNGGYELASVALRSFDRNVDRSGAGADLASVAESVQKVFEDSRILNPKVATSISGPSVVVRRIVVAATNEEELEIAVQHEAMQYMGFDLAEVSLNYYVLGPAASVDALDVLLIAVKRDKLQGHASMLARAKKVPVVMDIDAFALQNAFELSYEPPADQTLILLNVGASTTNLNITRGGLPLFTRDIPLGGNAYTEALQKELNLSFEDAEKLKTGTDIPAVQPQAELPILESVSEALLREIQKAFSVFRQAAVESIAAVYVAGGSARISGLVDMLGAEFKVPVEILDTFRKIHCDSGKFDKEFLASAGPRMAVALGLALRSFDAA
ncbi:MAG: type IV pilus assembly protein PilM, partial [Terriglobia bacterium]